MGRGLHSVPLRALLRHPSSGSREQVQPLLPPPRRRPFWGGGASPRLRGGGGPRLWLPSWGGCGGGGAPPPALRPEWEGGGEWGGRSGLLATPPDGRGGVRHGGPGAGGQPSAGGSRPSPAPLYLEPDPRAGPRWGPPSPRLSSRGAGRPGAAVRVSGQRLAGCGAAGSPQRSLSPPSLPREVARSPAPCRTVGGGVGRGAQLPPPLSRVRRLGHHLRRRLCGAWGCGGGGLRRR